MEAAARNLPGLMERSAARGPWWSISRDGAGGSVELLGVRRLGAEALPIFSGEEEAELYLRCSRPPATDGWQAREVGLGELVALLSGRSSADVKRVVLDPPAGVRDEAMLALFSVDSRILLDSLLGQGRAWFEGVRLRDAGREDTA